MTSTLRQTGIALQMVFRTTMREIGLILAFVVLFPLAFLFFLGAIVQPGLRTQVVVGAVMMETALLNVNVLAQSMGADKESKQYDLWVSLPVSPIVYVTALAVSLLPFSLLSAVLTIGVGVLAFGVTIPLAVVPVLFLGFLLVWASTLGIGFAIGVFGRTPRQINQVAQFVGIVMTFFAPVFYPVSFLPLPLRAIAYAWPITWGTVLLTGLLSSNATSVLEATVVLTAFAVASLVFIGRGIRWREV
ncbi:MAG: ABC transporter permease [Thermoplasmata archaeon]|nr:ABC transporter permease [Thermoplasmata archaeon]MCI4355653.1 ABC transporter permease [Thermoplasmata archaeon]